MADRHWTKREFAELDATRWPGECYTILECGCGVGNFIFPLLEQHVNVRAFACDFSHRAVDFVNERSAENSLSDRLTAFQADLTSDDLSLNVVRESCDLVTMIFVLSAIHPAKFNMTINSLVSVLKPGGKLLFRDYAINDHAMVRFKPGAKIDERMYMRQDGTRSFFFKKEELEELANECGLTVQSIGYCQRATINKKEGIEVKRWFLQATLVKT